MQITPKARFELGHPEPAPRSLRRRISPVQAKGGYYYEV